MTSTARGGRVEGRVAVVTGAAAGIGRAVACALAAEGATVVALDVDDDAGANVISSLRAGGARAVFCHTDVRDERAVEAAFDIAEHDAGPVGILVHCAGGSRDDDAPLDALESSAYDAAVDLNLRAAALCGRAALRRMRAHGGGSIVLLSSYLALGTDSASHAYAAAKGGVIALARAMAARYAADGIRVNVVAPGIVLTDRVRGRIGAGGVDLDAVTARHPGAVGEPADIAAVALFLAGDEARMITGSVIAADGGLSAF